MDPFLEMPPFWGDFSPKLLTAISNALLPQLLPRYDVRIEEYLVVTHEEERLRRVQPDVTISTAARWNSGTEGAVALAEPTTIELDYPEFEPLTQRHLRLVHRPTGRVVTVMELLSPTNKTPGEGGLDAYLDKRAEFLASRCHLVEFDLLRGGRRLPMAGPLPRGDYYVYVGRVGRRPRCQIMTWSLRSPLPIVPIPLLPEDPEVSLDLQAVFHAAYDPSLYDRRLAYDQQLLPPLATEDEVWLRQQLRECERAASDSSDIG
jgi:hypothetical protein